MIDALVPRTQHTIRLSLQARETVGTTLEKYVHY